MVMPGRRYEPVTGYRYGFNGKEKDKDVAADDYDFGARVFDGRIGRWLSMDPLQAKYPGESHYAFVSNSPILYADVDGRDKIITIILLHKDGTTTEIRKVDKNYFYYYKDARMDSPLDYHYKADLNITVTINESAMETFDVKNLITGYTSTIENAKDVSWYNYYFGRGHSGDNSGKTQYGFRYYGKGHDMDWQSGLPTAADGSEGVDLGKLIDLFGMIGPKQKISEAYGDLVTKWMRYTGKDMKQVFTALKIMTAQIEGVTQATEKIIKLTKLIKEKIEAAVSIGDDINKKFKPSSTICSACKEKPHGLDDYITNKEGKPEKIIVHTPSSYDPNTNKKIPAKNDTLPVKY